MLINNLLGQRDTKQCWLYDFSTVPGYSRAQQQYCCTNMTARTNRKVSYVEWCTAVYQYVEVLLLLYEVLRINALVTF